uniref:Ubiquitin-like protease family profile domain-containing protein n=1 Tax=Ditylenchus dipsaci TaxID=166011 RepID=A0A915EQ78_9BILA
MNEDEIPLKEDILKYKLVIMPIHSEFHYTMITLDADSKKISYFDSSDPSKTQGRMFMKRFTDYLGVQWTFIQEYVPQQLPGLEDCGICVIAAMESVYLGREVNYPSNMISVRRQIAMNLLDAENWSSLKLHDPLLDSIAKKAAEKDYAIKTTRAEVTD